MKDKVKYVAVLIIGLIGGFLINSLGIIDNSSSTSQAVKDGSYKVEANWDWDTLDVRGEKWILDNNRTYKSSTSPDGIVVLQGESQKSFAVYKIEKNGEKFELHSVSKDGVSKEAVVTLTKK